LIEFVSNYAARIDQSDKVAAMADESTSRPAKKIPAQAKVVLDAAIKSGLLKTDVPFDAVLRLGSELEFEADYISVWSNYIFIVNKKAEAE
jgi:hypothetical protein